jgi:hypothetical protein
LFVREHSTKAQNIRARNGEETEHRVSKHVVHLLGPIVPKNPLEGVEEAQGDTHSEFRAYRIHRIKTWREVNVRWVEDNDILHSVLWYELDDVVYEVPVRVYHSASQTPFHIVSNEELEQARFPAA